MALSLHYLVHTISFDGFHHTASLQAIPLSYFLVAGHVHRCGGQGTPWFVQQTGYSVFQLLPHGKMDAPYDACIHVLVLGIVLLQLIFSFYELPICAFSFFCPISFLFFSAHPLFFLNFVRCTCICMETMITCIHCSILMCTSTLMLDGSLYLFSLCSTVLRRRTFAFYSCV